jgi:putative ABC transport system permease protein
MSAVITRHFAALFVRQFLRGARRHPVLLALNILSIALGVAVFLAIQIANRSANESFRAGVEMVAGRANLELRGRVDDALLPAIAAVSGVRAASPILEGIVTLPGQPGEYLRVLGLDPFSGQQLRTFELLGANESNFDVEAWLRDRDAIAVSPAFAASLGHRGPVEILTDRGTRTLDPVFVIDPEDAAASLDPRTVAMDIGWAQELLGRPSELSAVLLLVDPAQLATATAALRQIVPGDVTVAPPARRSDQVESMLGAFQLNLSALSLVSLLVGTFLIYNTISASVVRRRTEIGTLRALGASRAEVRLLFLAEAGFAGAVGSVLGVLAALPIAQALTAPVAQTISSLYVALSIDRLYLSPYQIAFALAAGLATSLVAAWIPASEAANCDPASALRPGSAAGRYCRVPLKWLIAGAVCLVGAFACGLAALEFRVAVLGFFSAFLVLAGFSLVTPMAVVATAWAFRRAPRFLRLAAQNLARSNHRNAITIAALAAAIAMTVGVSVMIHSFRGSVDRWIGATLVADLFIGSAGNEIAGVQSSLPPMAVDWARSQPGVTNVTTFSEVPVDFRGERTALAVVSDSPEAGNAFLAPGRVAVSEPFATRFDVRAGDDITLPTPGGPADFRVAEIYQDYARTTGIVRISEENHHRHWPPVDAQSLAITLRPGSDPVTFGETFRAHFAREGRFSIYSNQALRSRIFEIFNQTFAVTFVLRTIAIGVAAAGVLLALLILAAEREREIGTLRAIGASRLQVVGLFLREASLIGAISSVIGVASGACLAVVLTFVVNKAYFGWTIELAYPLGFLAATPLWIIPVAVLAAILPAWRAADIPPARALRFE